MNKTLQEGVALATELKNILAAEKPNCEVVIGTPFIHLATVSELLKDSVIAVSAENCANHESGAYTGEVSAMSTTSSASTVPLVTVPLALAWFSSPRMRRMASEFSKS